MNHGEYQKSCKAKTVSELRFIIKDTAAAIRANPENPKNGYYADESHYATMELQRRKGAE